MKKLLSLFIVTLMICSLTACGEKPSNSSSDTPNDSPTEEAGKVAENDAIHLIYSSAAAINGAWTPGEEMFCKLVNERTNGKYVLDYYPLDSLTSGNQTKALEMVQMGVSDFDCRAGMFYSNISDKWNSILLPWAFPTYEDVDNFLLGEGGQKLAEAINESGLVFLAYGENGYRQLTNSIRPVKTPEDLSGMKLRVCALNMFFDMFNCFNANATTMNVTEVFSSLQQKAIEGQENPLDVINSLKFQEVQDYLTIWNCSYDPIVLVVNEKTWNRFTDEEKVIVKQAAEESMAYQREYSRARTEELLTSLKSEMETYVLSAEEIAAFREAVQPVYDKWAPKIGSDLMELIDSAN